MNKQYQCKISIGDWFDKTYLLKVINKGQNLGFDYFDIKDSSNDGKNLSKLSPDEVLKKIETDLMLKNEMTNVEPKDVLFDSPAGVVAHYLDTSFIITVEKGLHIVLTPINAWQKKFDDSDGERIDVRRYIKLLVALCEDFPCFEIKAGPLPCDDIRGSLL